MSLHRALASEVLADKEGQAKLNELYSEFTECEYAERLCAKWRALLLLEGSIVMTFLTLFLISLLRIWILNFFFCSISLNCSENTGF